MLSPGISYPGIGKHRIQMRTVLSPGHILAMGAVSTATWLCVHLQITSLLSTFDPRMYL